MYTHTLAWMLLNVHRPMHAYTRMHLHPDMKIIYIKASNLYEKKNEYIHVILLQVSEVNEESFWKFFG